MAGPQRRPRRRTIAVLVLLSITVLTLDFRGVGVIDGARELSGTVFEPLRSGADWAATPLQNMWHGVTDYGDVRGENERLRARIEELEGQQVIDEVAATQYPELLELVDIPWVGSINTAAAQVISEPVSNFSYVIDIDKGSDAGIKVGMPVVTGAGLVGRISLVASNRSQVQLITDPEFRVGVRIVATQELGTARGRGIGETLRVETGIYPDDAPEEGVKLTTSGLDRSVFPPSIPIGEVVSIRDAKGGLVLDLFAEPFADLDRLNFVNVLLWEGLE